MNKARRHELKMLKYKKRMKKMKDVDPNGKYYAYRSHSTPCSCGMCSYSKYDRARVKNFDHPNDRMKELIGREEMMF